MKYGLLEVAAARSLTAVSSVSTLHNPTPMADHACGPAAHAVPATVVVQAGPSTCQPPYAKPWATASEQAGRCRPPLMAVQSMGDAELVWWGVCAVLSIILLVW